MGRRCEAIARRAGGRRSNAAAGAARSRCAGAAHRLRQCGQSGAGKDTIAPKGNRGSHRLGGLASALDTRGDQRDGCVVAHRRTFGAADRSLRGKADRRVSCGEVATRCRHRRRWVGARVYDITVVTGRHYRRTLTRTAVKQRECK